MDHDSVVPAHDQMGPESELHITVGESGRVTTLTLWGQEVKSRRKRQGIP